VYTLTCSSLANLSTYVYFYCKKNINNKKLYKKALTEYRLAKNRAIERARKAEEENEKLKLKIKKYGNI